MERYISVDIESDGACPGVNSLLSIGAAAFDGVSEKPAATFYVNLDTLPEACVDESTRKFWEDNKEAYAATRVDTKPPRIAMRLFADWLSKLGGRPIFVGYPAAFDSLYVFWYFNTFLRLNPFGWHALDIKTYAMSVLGVPYSRAVKRHMPGAWFKDLPPHTHNALDDAIEQGILFTRIHKANHERHATADSSRSRDEAKSSATKTLRDR